MHRLLKWVSAILILIVIIGGGWFWYQYQQDPKNTQQNKPLVMKTVRVVGVGDSLTQGIGYDDDHQGYLPILKQQLSQDYDVKPKTANFGIGGERSDQIDRRVQTNQKLRRALRRANVIAITAGGNDLLQSLEKNITVNSNAQMTQKMTPLKTKYQQKLTQLIADVHEVNPRAQIYLFGIYNPVYVYFTNATMISTAVNQWNQVNQQVAASQPKTHFVNVNRALSHGQYQSANAQAKLKEENQQNNQDFVDPGKVQTLLQTQDSKEKNAYLSTEDHFHPNKKGYHVMASKLGQAIQSSVNWPKR
ncbi:lysophospholipase [Lactobacillus sp. LC28-10]|uniref:Lysophospholipase n=1 Tax=Secundilactobacillus angelensis TaxID=2722706 RepID=A0ABX1KV63_9LACO|nr:GDSL-type esterase/lipase family protein [Secundilactobacillus angelensis]MCH5461381.1 GDSL-type esterase/lipase family protein [Secundilactobacillus angelensis]NLR17806.1 lysophospholipase [Secundilactobacillus angelensis]